MPATAVKSYWSSGNLIFEEAIRGNDAVIQFGVDDYGIDVKFFGATSNKYALWDQSADTFYVVGTLSHTGDKTITGDITHTGKQTTTETSTVAGGSVGIQSNISQVAGTALTGTLRGIYAIATNGTTAATGTIRGAEIKARAATSDNTGANVTTLEGISVSADAKNKTATTLRGIEIMLDGAAGGASTLAQGLLISNNSSATQTTSYAVDINSGTASGHKAFTADLRLQNGETISNATDGVVVISGIVEAATLQSALAGHLALNTQASNKNVRINSQTFTTDASIVAAQIKPAAGVALTNGIVGLEVEPRINDTFAGTSIHGIFAGPWKRGTGAAGNLSGDFLAIEGKLQSDSGYSGTITGPAAILRAVNSLHGTVTTGPVVIYANQHEGNVAWTALLEGAEALGTHSLTTATDKTGNTKSGTLKVRFNNTEYHIQLYAAA